MNINLINSIIKNFFIILFSNIILLKVLNYKKITIKLVSSIIIFSIITAIIYATIKLYANTMLALVILCIALNLFAEKLLEDKISLLMMSILISLSICIVTFGISVIINFFIWNKIEKSNNFVQLFSIILLQGFLIYSFFRVKRFNKGFEFLKNNTNNEYIDIIMINISIIIIFIYSISGSYSGDELTKHIFITLMTLGIIMILMIQKTLILHYKQKLLENTINDYKDIINKKDEAITRLTNEKTNYSKIAHEFYNRQKALEIMVRESVDKYRMEASEELEVLTKVENLTKEYSKKIEAIKTLPELQKTDISEIDNMIKYMQSECYKNNIEFKLKIAGNIHYLTNNIIEKSKLETLIGDHIRDAIIAINSSNNTNKEILVILGIKDNKYQFCVYDTGIEFEINTLLKLGLERVTTHKNDGGSGIGFMTTFETLKECKASLIIEELNKESNSYTKAVIIRFDGKNEYKIQSYRADEIKKRSKDDRITIEKL